jgi:serine protease
MRWAVGLHIDGVPDNPTPAKVPNMSIGGCTAGGDCSCDAAYQNAVDDVLAQGAVIVVAAGNSNGGPVEAPASCSGVIAVAAVRHVGTKVGFSSLGPEVAISAPGGNCVISTGACLYPIIAATNTGATVAAASSWFDSYRFEYGTSFSAPLVAGVAGLMFSAAPTLTPAQVRSLLMSTSSTFPSTGGTAGTLACHAPTSAVQDECYCTTTTCGAGMLNAGAAVTAAAATVTTPVAHIVVTTTSPTAGSAVTLSATTSTGGSGSVITVYKWTLADGGGIVTAFTSADNASTATLTPTAAGTFKVTLAVTDGNMETALAEQTVTVAAAPVVVTPPAASGGGGGGATSVPWLALLALATAALFRARPRRA